jgi:uncharacterized lipoprotein YddW (UPF0748 family)
LKYDTRKNTHESSRSLRFGGRRTPRLARRLVVLSVGIALSGLAPGCGGEPRGTSVSELPAVSSGPPPGTGNGIGFEHEANRELGELGNTGAIQSEPASKPEPTPDIRYRGLWVLCEGSRRVLEDPARIDRLILDAQALEVTDLFVQVYRGGRAWFPTALADDAPYQAIFATHGADPLAQLIARAHTNGLRVHAWVNVLSLSRNREAPILKQLGPGAVHVDRKGRSILDYPADLELPNTDRDWYRVGTPGIYLDPGAPGVSESLVAVFRELVVRYPELDGLHLDYIRHPGVLPFAPGSRFGVGLDYGYGEASRLRFRRETGVRGPYANDAAPDPSRIVNANRWDTWRRDQVTELVAQIGEATAEVNPRLRLSAAVISYLDRAYLSLAQDWRRWLEEGLLDFAVPMVYSKDDRLVRYQVEAFASGPQAERIWAGIGVWLFAKDPQRARAQLEIVGRTQLAGDALFSYDAIYAARAEAQPTQLGENPQGTPTGESKLNLFSAIASPSGGETAGADH